MKENKQFLLTIVSVLMTLFLVNCSSGGGSNNSTPTNPNAYGNCSQTAYNGAYNNGAYNTGANSQYCNGAGGGGYGGGGTGNPAMCQGRCGPGNVSVNNGQGCLPKYSCGDCYGYSQGGCYIGDFAHQFYGM